jgi:hypothetical protein
MEGETDTDSNIAINWNNIVGQEARSVDNADLGRVQGLFEPFIVTERGTINKEKFYIPKSVIKRYTDEILFFDITEQQAKDYCMRTTPPSEYEEKGIVQIISDARSRKEEGTKKEEGVTRTDTQIVSVEGEIQRRRSKTSLSRVDINEKEIANKLKTAVNEFKDMVISGTKAAKLKVKQTQEIIEEKQAKRDEEKISKMGILATRFTNSFDDILYEIKAKTYQEQEEIYTGFLKLIEQQRNLIIARRDLAAKLKDSIQRPVVSSVATENPALEQKQQQLGVVKEPELPSTQDPQLPEIISATSAAEDESKIESQIITAVEEEPPEQITASTANTESKIKKQSVNRSEPSKTSPKSKSSKVKKKTR